MSASLPRDDYLAIVTRALATQARLPVEDIQPGHHLAAIPGIESVTILRAVVEIEENCSVSIPDDFLFEIATVADLAQLVADRAGQS